MKKISFNQINFLFFDKILKDINNALSKYETIKCIYNIFLNV